MTVSEYWMRLEAYNLQMVEKRQALHMQAFLNQLVQATEDKKGTKPMFKTFNDFFHREEEINQVRSTFERDYKPKSDYKPKKDNSNSGMTRAQRLEIAKRISAYNKRKFNEQQAKERRNADG